jgi:hypothetical protein
VEEKNVLFISGDRQQVSIIVEIFAFGHVFKPNSQKPLDFIICEKDDPEACAYLEVGEFYLLHDEEPQHIDEHGYDSKGIILRLELGGDVTLPKDIYPLKKVKQEESLTKESGE